MDDAGQLCDDFEAAAHETFDVLCDAAGFRCVESRPERVRYESPAVFFEVGFSVNYDREVYARIGRIGVPGVSLGEAAERLDFGLYLAVADPDGYTEFSRVVPYSIAGSKEQLQRALSYFAAGLRVHGRALLSGGPEAYSQARALRFWHLTREKGDRVSPNAEPSAAADRGRD